MIPTLVSVWQILFRQRSTLVALLIFPALLTFVAGIGYDHNNNIPLTIGAHSTDWTPLGSSVLEGLEARGYRIIHYKNLDLCLKRVRQTRLHSCVDLSKKGREQAVFYVNPSDLSLAEHLRTVVQETAAGPTSAVAENSTRQLLSEVSNAREAASQIRPTIVDLTTNYQEIAHEVDDFVVELRKISPSLNISAVAENNSVEQGHDSLLQWVDSLGRVKSDIINEYDRTLQDVKTMLDESAISEADRTQILSRLYDGQRELDEISDEFRSSELLTRSKSDQLTEAVQGLADQLEQLQIDIQSFNRLKHNARYKADKIKQHVDKTLLGVASVQRSLNIIGATVLDVTKPQDVLAPLDAKIGTVSRDGTPFDYIFPNVLLLFVLVAGVSLGSMVHVHFQHSPGALRQRVAPISQRVHLVAQHVGVWSIVFSIGIVMSASALAFLPLHWATLPGLALAVGGTGFVSVLSGSWIGHFLRNEEQAVLWGLGGSSLSILLSPMLRPIEQLPGLLRILAEANPLTCGLQVARSAVGGGTINLESLGILLLAGASLWVVLLLHKQWNT